MDSHTDTSYQDDILKVKHIWNDLKDMGKQTLKQNKNLKEKNKATKNNKEQQAAKQTKDRNSIKKTGLDLDKNKQKNINPANVIKFSTISQQGHSNGQNQRQTKKPGATHNNNYIQNYNYRLSLQQKDSQISYLRVTNQRLRDQVYKLQKQIQEKENLIAKLRSRQHELLGVTSKFQSEKMQAMNQNVQYINYKNESKRLLKMLQTTQEYQQFARFALQDDGVKYLFQAGKKSKTNKIDATNPNQHKVSKTIHFCSCNSEFIPEHNFWVPEKVYDFGRDFVKKNKGQTLSEAEMELLLYQLNKLWRQRQKRIVNSLSALKALEVGDYKRKAQEYKRAKESQVTISNEIYG